MQTGKVSRISGPVIVAKEMKGAKMYDVVKVGESELSGEIIRLYNENAVIQVYEDTVGIKVGEPVSLTGMPLSVKLGPGLLSSIYDGIQRPLPGLAEISGDFIERGLTLSGLDERKLWDFLPAVKENSKVIGGSILGTVQEYHIEHKILVPPFVSGVIEEINEGKFTVDDPVCRISGGKALTLSHKWPVRKGRPFKEKLDMNLPLVTGQRIFDSLFPVAKGGTAMIPGGFGTGKTVSEQSLAKWSDTQIIVYIGCGERGNEMTDVLKEFPEIIDTRTGFPLIQRTVLIANTSNMPVAAREASIYTGVAMAEYYRDMGYDVALMADSTSRWGEALREVSGRLEEMPGEEGYPAYLAARIAAFYERAGRVSCLGPDARAGSITIIGAVSPPGGDFSEPITQNTLRVSGTFWALDSGLANRRHFPSVNWVRSYSLYLENLEMWFTENVSCDWRKFREQVMIILQKETELLEIVKLVGADSLPEQEKSILEVARMIREDFLQQSAFDPLDAYCSLEKQFLMIRTIIKFSDALSQAIARGVKLKQVMALPVKDKISRMKQETDLAIIEDLIAEIDKSIGSLEADRE